MRGTANSVLVAIILGVCAFASVQRQKPWTWKDRTGQIRSRAELEVILKQRTIWLESDGKSGCRADLTQADLTGADLTHAVLTGADLTDADLSQGKLRAVKLNSAELNAIKLRDADLSESHLAAANLTGADLTGAQLTKADLRAADLTDADLSQSTLADARMGNADLSGAVLTGANLRGADMARVDLTNAELNFTNLVGAFIGEAHLAGAEFEPEGLPILESTALAYDLELVTYSNNPGPLTRLRKQFQDAGYREQERAITYALNRHNADPRYLWALVNGDTPHFKDATTPLWSHLKTLSKSVPEGLFKWLAFDVTCEYGLSPWRPLGIVGILWVVFSFVYAIFMHCPGGSGIYFVGTRLWRGKSNTQAIQIRPRAIRDPKWWQIPFLWLQRGWRVLRAAMFFSLMSAFNIGFRDINFGRWLRLLTKREYDLRAVGWARTVSGFQSLLSVYLIALWLLTYFGRPFG